MITYSFRNPEAYHTDSNKKLFKVCQLGAFMGVVALLVPSFEMLFSFIPESWVRWHYDQEKYVSFRDSTVGMMSLLSAYYLGTLYISHMKYRCIKKKER